MPADVVVYTLHYCPFCTRVKELLANHGIAFKEIDFTDNDDLRREVEKRSGQMTAPQVFINGKSVGGYDQVRELADMGLLDKLVNGV